ncbi:hypothetical protein MLD38_035427 [Melastoma candidum]|uniref:Uncharacterized protein n=1 Tax=Melastoma candidum TaxID=119954 RepID=A0ACB9LGM3_9MYRT|nr:hypothetical protein MLD38_035427 [Melastoma candidum]
MLTKDAPYALTDVKAWKFVSKDKQNNADEAVGIVVWFMGNERILLDYSSHVFIQKLLGRYSFLDELSTLDHEVCRNLMYIKHYVGDVKDLFLIVPSQRNYLESITSLISNCQMMPFANAFFQGLTDLISASWLKLFNANELNHLLSGGDHDVDDLEKNTCHNGGYSEGMECQNIMGGKRTVYMLLKFVTSCSQVPLLGFKHLQPTFTINKVPLWAMSLFGQQPEVRMSERLPSASTCYNTLKFPTYKRASTTRARLPYAISSYAGFELSKR